MTNKLSFYNKVMTNISLFLISAFVATSCSLSGKIKNGKSDTASSSPSTPVQGSKEISFLPPTEYITPANQSNYTISGTCDVSSKIVIEVNSSMVKNDVDCIGGQFSTQLDLSSYTPGDISFRAYPIESTSTIVPETTVAVVKDTTAPSVSGTVTDGTSYVSVNSSPTLSWTAATDAHSGIAKYQIALGTTSGGTDVVTWTDIGTVTSYQFTSLTLTRGNTYYASVRAVDNAGNISSSILGDGWQSDSQVNAVTNISLLEADNSISTSPDVTFSYSSTGNTLAFSEYEYSVGSTSGGTDIKTWTSLGSSTSFQATGLTLSVDTDYYINIRAKDVSGKTSSVATGQWRVVNSVTVAARYSSAPNWNDYVKKSATTTACQTTDTYYYNCIHGGEKKEISVTGENSCTGMTAYDTLGVFDWVCQAGTPVKMVSIEVKPGKGLKDLVNATSWKNNRIVVKKSGTPVAASTATTWWTNTVSALPDSTSGQITLSSASNIYTVSTSQLTRGYYINAHKVAVVTLGDAKLTLDPAGSANATNTGSTGSSYYAMFINGTRMHTWLEGHFVGNFYTSSTLSYLTSGGFLYFNVINNSKIEDFYYGLYYGPTKTLIKSVRSSKNRFFHYAGNNSTDLNYSVVKNSSFQSEHASIGGQSGTGLIVISNFFTSSATSGLNMAYAIDSNIISNTIDTGFNAGATTRATVHNTLYPAIMISNGSSSELTLSHFVGRTFAKLHGATNFKLSGLLGYNTCSAWAFMGTGITDSCGNAGTSNATAVAPIDILAGSTFGGFVSSDTNHPGYNASTGVAYSSITNWTTFDRTSRFWVDSNRGTCLSGETCYIYDYALSAADAVVLNKSGDLSSANDAFSSNAADNCPSQVHGSQTITDQRTSAQTFLKNAIEITGDAIGDEDGLCETNEACIYSPNIGAYQGHGDFTSRTCTFQNGTVTGVTMYAYPTNGY